MIYGTMKAEESKKMKKSFSVPKKLYRIGEIIHATGLSRQTIHNYTVFGLITEAERTEAGHRLYDESVFSSLSRIEELKSENKTLREIRKIVAQENKSK